MSDHKRDYAVGRGNARAHPFQEGPVRATLLAGHARRICQSCWWRHLTSRSHGERRRITKREAIITQLVYKFTTAIDMLKEVEQKTGAAAPRGPAKLSPADREVVEQFIAR